MALIESFTTTEEDQLTQEFLEQGYLIKPVDNRAALDSLRTGIIEIISKHIGAPPPKDEEEFLNFIHKTVPIAKLNEMRLATFSQMNTQSWFKPTYYALARSLLNTIVGNELAIQNKINLSVQYPDDKSSLLNVHADTWSEESPFQVVVWLPLVNVFDTKSMYILDPAENRTVRDRLKEIVKEGGSDKLFDAYKDKFKWLNVPYGHVLLFSPTLLHGNVLNSTPETRWSMNCRFKSIFTPYMSEEKKLGTFYLPITTKPITRVGVNYKIPEGFDE